MRKLACLLSVIGLTSCTGCVASMVAKQGLKEIRGTKSAIYDFQRIPPSVGRSASGLKIGGITCDGCGATEFRGALYEGLNRTIARTRFSGSGEPLSLRLTIRFFEGKGEKMTLGGTAFAIVRVEAYDAQNNLVGKCDAVTSTEAYHDGEGGLGDSMAKKIVAWAIGGGKKNDG